MLIASNVQACIHLKHPVHLRALYMSTCSVINVPPMNKNDLSITLFGQTLMHFQQPVQA